MFKKPGQKSVRAGKWGKRPRHRIITADQFREAREFTGFDREDAANLLGVSLRTIGHWETGKAVPPYAAFKLLRMYLKGDLVHPAWQGFRIAADGSLVTPERHSFKPHDLAWLSLTFRRAEMFSVLYARGAGASEASVGLVSSTTSGKPAVVEVAKPLKNKANQQTCNDVIMGPLWGHNAPVSVGAYDGQEVQYEVPCGSDRGSQGRGCGNAHQPQLVHRASGDEPHGVHAIDAVEAGQAASGVTTGHGSATSGRRRLAGADSVHGR